MNCLQSFDCLDLDDHQSLHEQVNAIPVADRSPTIDQGKGSLTFELETTLGDLEGQARLAGRLEQSRSEFPMHCDRRADDLLRQVDVFVGHAWT